MLQDLISLLAGNAFLFAGVVFVLGLMVGSFLNVVIYRLPIMLERQWRAEATAYAATAGASAGEAASIETSVAAQERITLSHPRSACPHCRAPIKAWQNVPLLSWVLLKGRCAACRAPISMRYPAVELATGLLSAWVAWNLGFGVAGACGLLLTWALVALAGIDLDHQLLPDDITLPLLWAGLLAAVLLGSPSGAPLPVAPRDAILGAAGGYGSLWLVFHAFRLVTGKEGMGYGDFKLFAALGAWLGWRMLPLIILLAAVTGALLGILMIALRGRDRASPMPFGPYLAAAGWLAMLYGAPLVAGYRRLSGL